MSEGPSHANASAGPFRSVAESSSAIAPSCRAGPNTIAPQDSKTASQLKQVLLDAGAGTLSPNQKALLDLGLSEEEVDLIYCTALKTTFDKVLHRERPFDFPYAAERRKGWQRHLTLARSEIVAGDALIETKWTLADWLHSLKMYEAIAKKLSEYINFSEKAEDKGNPHVQLSFMKHLGEYGSQEEIEHLLHDGDILKVISKEIFLGAKDLRRAKASTAAELHEKFQQEGATQSLAYGGVSIFFAGLEGLVGSPDRQIEKAMRHEHCESPDSMISFTTTNYGINTTSKAEWYFVRAPEGGPEQAGLKDWPREARSPEGRADYCRTPKPLNYFSNELAALNKMLNKAGEPEVMDDEICGLRLYTGPMFVKYNTVLRGFANDKMKEKFRTLCLDNLYTTTLHVINSGIVKSSKVTQAAPVYRGIKDGILPPEFWNPNEFNVCGGIEYAFMSTTANKDVALDYASSGAMLGTIFEIRMGMIDRGADLSPFSQYPHEKEICFAPLTGLEVVSTRVEGAVLVVQMHLSINLSALTIEQVLQKRRKVVADMCASLIKELKHELQGANWQDLAREIGCPELQYFVEEMVTEKLNSITQRPPTDFNDDHITEQAFREALAAVKAVRLQRAEVLEAVAARLQGGYAQKISDTAAAYLDQEFEERSVTVSGKAPFGDLRNVRGGLLALLGLRHMHGALKAAETQTYERTNGGSDDNLITRWEKSHANGEDVFGTAWHLFKVDGLAGSIEILEKKLHELYHADTGTIEANLTFSRPRTHKETNDLAAKLATSVGETEEDVTRCSRQIHRLVELSPHHFHCLSVPKGTDLKNKGGKVLAQMLRTNANIREFLLFDHANIGEEAGKAFAKALETNTAISKFVLNGNNLGDTAGEAFASALGRNHTISRLDLKHADLGDKAGEALAKVLENNNSSLEWLSLDKNKFGERAGFAFATMLQRNTTVKKLVLNGNPLGDKAGESLANALETNRTVEGLFFDDSGFGQNAGEAFAKALEMNSTLDTLFLGDNEIGEEGAKALAQALWKNTKIHQLSLKNNDLGDTVGEAFAQALQRNSTLTTLGLTDNRLGDTAGQALAKALEKNKGVKVMKLSRNKFGDSAGQAFAEALERNTNIQSLWLEKNNIGQAGAEALVNAVEKNAGIQGIDFDTDGLGETAKVSLRALAESRGLKNFAHI